MLVFFLGTGMGETDIRVEEGVGLRRRVSLFGGATTSSMLSELKRDGCKGSDPCPLILKTCALSSRMCITFRNRYLAIPSVLQMDIPFNGIHNLLLKRQERMSEQIPLRRRCVEFAFDTA